MITEFYFYRFLKIQKASGQPIYQQHRQHAEYWGVCWSHTIIVSIGRSNRGSRSSPKFSRFSPKFWPCHGVLTCWLGWSAETYSCRLNRQVKVNNIKTNRISPEPTHYRSAPLQGHIKKKFQIQNQRTSFVKQQKWQVLFPILVTTVNCQSRMKKTKLSWLTPKIWKKNITLIRYVINLFFFREIIFTKNSL